MVSLLLNAMAGILHLGQIEFTATVELAGGNVCMYVCMYVGCMFVCGRLDRQLCRCSRSGRVVMVEEEVVIIVVMLAEVVV